MDPDELTRALAADSRNAGDPTAWFEQLYAAARAGGATVPWDRGTPNVLLAEWVEGGLGVPPLTASTVVVGAGYGRDSEYLASLGYPTVAFDISPTAVAQTRERFPGSPVDYTVADLFDLPGSWRHGFGFVLESLNVQALPDPQRSDAIRSVASLVGPGGTLLVLESGHDGPAEARDALETPPWPLLRNEIESFAVDGLEMVSVERVVVEGHPDVPRWRAVLGRA